MNERKGDDDGRRFRVPIDPDRLEATLEAVREQLGKAASAAGERVDHARHLKVRLSFNGKPLGPDMPLALLLAGEGLMLLTMGPIRFLVGNLGLKAFLDIEVLHKADELVDEGRELFSQGEPEKAEGKYRAALHLRPDDPSALYHLGVLCRVSGRRDEAERLWHKAAAGPEGHPAVELAAKALERAQKG